MSATLDELCGRKIGDFVLREQIGAGAFGAVYRCEQPLLDREAVVKVLHGPHRTRPVMIQRFLREARLASRLDHPYAAHVYAFGVEHDDGLLWIAMEMVHGMPLDRWLRDRGPLALAVLVPFFEHLAEVVHAAHEAGIVHRDIKPANIMVVERSGRLLPKLLDLGIATMVASNASDTVRGARSARAPRVTDTSEGSDAVSATNAVDLGDATPPFEHATLTASRPQRGMPLRAALTGSDVIGSPPYMAPEQWEGGPVGPAADLYALAIVAYESLTGRRPFGAASMEGLADLHLTATAPLLGAGFAATLDRFFVRALDKRPKNRPATALALAAELRAAAGLDELAVEWIVDDAPAGEPDDAMGLGGEPACPYPGMRAYTSDAATHFHGRDSEIADLIGRLRAGEREIYVIGPSGSGKSSLVAAGAVPQLMRGRAGVEVVVRSLRPGEHPAARLAAALDGNLAEPAAAVAVVLARHSQAAVLLLVIDQLEELFTLARSDERAQFITTLRALREEPRVQLILTLRADFYGTFMQSPLWADSRGRIARIEVAPLSGRAMQAAIEQPARNLGITFEPELVERLLADAAGEPGTLPLLQETLIQLWDRRRLRTIALADYAALGDGSRSGLAVAIAGRADAVLGALSPVRAVIARRILLRLVSFGEGRPDTRRQLPVSALRAASDSSGDFDAVLRQLVSDRLLTISDRDRDSGDHRDGGRDSDAARVDLAHEVMISAWPALVGWIASRRADEQRRRQLEVAAAQWHARGRGDAGLLDLVELTEAEAWRQTAVASDLGESPAVAALIAASRHAHDRQRRRSRRLAGTAVVVATLAVAAIVALAIGERRRADEADVSRRDGQQLLARSYRDTAQQLVFDGRPLEAVPYLVAARRAGEDDPPLRMLFAAATQVLSPVPPLVHRDAVVSVAFSPDGSRIVTASSDGTARVWDAATGAPLGAPLAHRDRVLGAAFSPDGARVVTASDDGTARVWDAVTGAPRSPPLVHRGRVLSAAFNPNGTRIVTTGTDYTARVWDAATGVGLAKFDEHLSTLLSANFSPDGARIVTASADGTARVWDAVTGARRTPPLVHRREVLTAMFSSDGTRIVTASMDGTARVWNAATGAPVAPPLAHRGGVMSARFSPDGARVATASDDRSARVWDSATGASVSPPLVHLGTVWSVAFSSDSARVITASSDRTARVWDVATGALLSPSLEHRRSVLAAAFDHDAARAVTASQDGTVRLWNVARLPLPPLGHSGPLFHAAFSSDGTRVVTASADGTARVWNAATAGPLSPPLAHGNWVFAADFSRDGARVVTASFDGTARVWDTATGAPSGPPLGHLHSYCMIDAAFSLNGARIVTADAGGTARVWDAMTGAPLSPLLRHANSVRRATFSPDGARIVTASSDHTAQVWDAASGAPLGRPLTHRNIVMSAVFSSDGARVVTASWDHTAQVWDAATGAPLTPPLLHRDSVDDAQFSPDGARVVTASADRTARVWDAATGAAIGPPLAHQAAVNSARFSPDGTRVVTASADRTARVWDAATGAPLSAPLPHRNLVYGAEFSPDGARVLTWSEDGTARLWELSFAAGTVAEWEAIEERSGYALREGVLVTR